MDGSTAPAPQPDPATSPSAEAVGGPASAGRVSPFRRHPGNPVLTADDLDHDCILVFNAGVVRWDDGFLMAYRADKGRPGDPHVTGTDIGFVVSDDGLGWRATDLPTIDRAAAIALLAPLEPHRDLEAEVWRIYDPRLTAIELDGRRRLLLSFAVDTTHGLRPGLAMSDDARDWKALALGPPDDRNHVVFPERIGDRWFRLERPMHEYGGAGMGAGRHGIVVSSSPDLVHWGAHRLVLTVEDVPFAGAKLGPGAPPVRTDEGWLCLFHAVTEGPSRGRRGWEPDWNRTYTAGVALLDLDDPSRVRALAPTPVLEPVEPYETNGYRNDVVFPTAALVVGGDLWCWYGAADTVVALATAPLADLMAFVLGV